MQIQSRYCPDCGQRADLSLRSIRATFTDVIGAVFSYDNKLWRSLTLLCFRPGALTKAYWQGKRSSYVDPLRLFLFFSVIVFFAPDTIGADRFLMPEEWTGPAAEGLSFFDRFRIGAERFSLRHQLDLKVQDQFKIEIGVRYLTIYMAAGVLGLALFQRLIRRRSYFVEHFTFGLHIACIVYFSNLAIRLVPLNEYQQIVEIWGTFLTVCTYFIWAYQVLYARPGFWRRLLSLATSVFAFLAFLLSYLATGQLCAIFLLMPEAG